MHLRSSLAGLPLPLAPSLLTVAMASPCRGQASITVGDTGNHVHASDSRPARNALGASFGLAFGVGSRPEIVTRLQHLNHRDADGDELGLTSADLGIRFRVLSSATRELAIGVAVGAYGRRSTMTTASA